MLRSKMIIKKHWLHGDIKYNVDVEIDDNCAECTHWNVCKRDMSHFCLNYCFGTSERHESCNGCLHRHTRKIWHERDGIHCFKCKWFVPIIINPSLRKKR